MSYLWSIKICSKYDAVTNSGPGFGPNNDWRACGIITVYNNNASRYSCNIYKRKSNTQTHIISHQRRLLKKTSFTVSMLGSQGFPSFAKKMCLKPWVYHHSRWIKWCHKIKFTIPRSYIPLCVLYLHFSSFFCTHSQSDTLHMPASLTARQLFLHNGIFHLTTSQDGLSL